MIKSRKDFEVGDYFLRFSKLESYKVGKLYHYFPTSRSPRGIVDDYRTFATSIKAVGSVADQVAQILAA